VSLVWGEKDLGSPQGIAALVAGDEQLRDSVNSQLLAAQGRLEEIGEPLEETLLNEPEIVARAQDALRTLQIVLQVDLAQALSVTIAFNDNDGD